jgi:hypothetical protein
MARYRRWLVGWLLLTLFGLMPAGLVVLVERRNRGLEPLVALEAAASGHALALDAHLLGWRGRVEGLAEELAGLLAQLPDGPMGSAAEGTLMLHLQRRLAREPEIGDYSVLAPNGTVMLSTDGTRPRTRDPVTDPEVHQATQRATAVLIGTKQARLVVAGPIHVGGSLRGILVVRPRTEVVERLLRPGSAGGGWAIELVDASGVVLSGRALPAKLRELGSESRAARAWVEDRPVAYVPLAHARAVVLAVGPSPRPPLRVWHWLGGLAIIALAGLAALVVARRASAGRP